MGSKASAAQLETLFRRSAQLLQQGDAAAAKPGLLKVVRSAPGSAVAWYNLGLTHQHLGEHERAVSAYRKSLSIRRDNADAWVNLGLSLKALGETADATKAAHTALGYRSRHPRALNLLGTIEAEQRGHDEARQWFERSLAAAPHDQEARSNLANLLLATGDTDGALREVKRLLDAEPERKDYRRLLAEIHIARKELEASAPLVMGLLGSFPDDDDVLRLALHYREAIRDHFGVIETAQKLIERFPDDADLWNSLGSGYFQLDGIGKAQAYYQKAVELDPRNAEYENNLGLVYSSLGDKDAAERHYRRALELDPGFAEAYRSLATMKRYESPDDPDIKAVEGLWAQEVLDDFSCIKLAFALGKMYDDCGAHDEAFKVYRRGNELKFRESRIDLDKYFAHIDRVAEVFDRRPETVVTESPRPRPIFILGMPRSGTTLVEQIISRHPQVTGCGELPCIERAITRIEKKSLPQKVYPDDFWSVPRAALTGEMQEYIAWVHKLHDIETPCITDKMPFNFVHVWLVRALFPDAPVVHCRRHPLDVIVSNYFQLYGSDISFVYDLEALATYYVRYYRLMAHWHRLFGESLYAVQYEAMTEDTETETRALIDAVGLPWDDACLDQKLSGMAVRTASIWQVRQGIYTSSRARWRKYEQHLGPVKEILAANAIPF